jgi:hypothetical protein
MYICTVCRVIETELNSYETVTSQLDVTQASLALHNIVNALVVVKTAAQDRRLALPTPSQSLFTSSSPTDVVKGSSSLDVLTRYYTE